jgi:5'(3')-deoxyribonucleotidase
MIKKVTLRKKLLLIELDDIVVDLSDNIKKRVNNWEHLIETEKEAALKNVYLEYPHYYQNLSPINLAIQSINSLSNFYDIYFISAPCWDIPNMYTDKRIWVENHFGENFRKKLILSHRKDLQVGHYLIDRKGNNGSDKFINELIPLGSEEFKDWDKVLIYLIDNYEVFWPETFEPKNKGKLIM